MRRYGLCLSAIALVAAALCHGAASQRGPLVDGAGPDVAITEGPTDAEIEAALAPPFLCVMPKRWAPEAEGANPDAFLRRYISDQALVPVTLESGLQTLREPMEDVTDEVREHAQALVGERHRTDCGHVLPLLGVLSPDDFAALLRGEIVDLTPHRAEVLTVLQAAPMTMYWRPSENAVQYATVDGVRYRLDKLPDDLPVDLANRLRALDGRATSAMWEERYHRAPAILGRMQCVPTIEWEPLGPGRGTMTIALRWSPQLTWLTAVRRTEDGECWIDQTDEAVSSGALSCREAEQRWTPAADGVPVLVPGPGPAIMARVEAAAKSVALSELEGLTVREALERLSVDTGVTIAVKGRLASHRLRTRGDLSVAWEDVLDALNASARSAVTGAAAEPTLEFDEAARWSRVLAAYARASEARDPVIAACLERLSAGARPAHADALPLPIDKFACGWSGLVSDLPAHEREIMERVIEETGEVMSQSDSAATVRFRLRFELVVGVCQERSRAAAGYYEVRREVVRFR